MPSASIRCRSRLGAMARRIVLGFVLGIALVLTTGASDGLAADGEPPLVVRYFYGDGCPFCDQQSALLDAWEQDTDVVVIRSEVWNDGENRAQFQALAAAYGQQAGGVPATFIGTRLWVGFDERIAADMQGALDRCLVSRDCIDPLTVLQPGVAVAEQPVPPGRSVRVPGVGDVELGGRGMLPATLLIAFVDGFNPCSLWVLSVLLALLLRTGSRGRIAVVGGVFLLVTAAVYGAFIAGVFTAMSVVDSLGWVRGVVAVVALSFAAINIKDHIAFKRGPSLTIGERSKPRIYRGGRRLIDPTRSLPGVVGATVVLALGVALVELPCTAGFPVLWSAMLGDAGIVGAEFAGLLAVYLGVYLLDEVVLFGAVVVTLRITRFEERHGRDLKLLGGTVMLALGLVMLVAPTLLHDLAGTVLVFLSALVLAAGIRLVTAHLERRRAPTSGARPAATPGRRGPVPRK